MGTVVYIVDPDAQERQWIENVLSPSVDSVRSLDNADALLALLGAREGACLVLSVDPNESAALELVSELRLAGSMMPVIAIGPDAAFRTATSIARLAFTDFIGRPMSAHGLRSAVARSGGTLGLR
jgi:FixJ family two-component response regulator